MKEKAERLRISERHAKPWQLWGPYLSERQWATVREDYSANGDAWSSFPHDHARSRAYRWGEDGLLGISDEKSRLCFAVALWNEADAILKERPFGLTGHEGNHGEDVKEYYYYLDNTPTHSYMKALYKYPQKAFPYDDLVQTNQARGRDEPEYELMDTGLFADNAYFDVEIEYAKSSPTDLFIRITATNRGDSPAPLHILPTLWFRNTWSWGYAGDRPHLSRDNAILDQVCIKASHVDLDDYWLEFQDNPELLFTENDTNTKRLGGNPSPTPYVKDSINDAVVNGIRETINPAEVGTKAAAHYKTELAAHASTTIILRLSSLRHARPLASALACFETCRSEADGFYSQFAGRLTSDDAALVQRQAFAGLLWSKQFYTYDVTRWLKGDPSGPQPPTERLHGRNSTWPHIHNSAVISMPDTWEYPWYAAWDLAFQCVPLARIDPGFAKQQLLLLLEQGYMHPDGQIPAYEWEFSDVNPPVQAWAALHVYALDRQQTDQPDVAFLQRCFHKLLLNFTWWVNRKDAEGRNIFQGGFLGLDNIGVFNRSGTLVGGGHLEQADGTAWMGTFCLSLMKIALELAASNPVYEDMAIKFFEHFMYIAAALNNIGGEGLSLWDDEDEFFYDMLHVEAGASTRLRVRSLVGLLPLLAVETVSAQLLDSVPHFHEHLTAFLDDHPDLASLISFWHVPGQEDERLVALVRGHRMKRLLARMFDPDEFLSPIGVRSLSRFHLAHPYELTLEGTSYNINYEPAESTTGLFGGNSNWRGPVWYPANYLLIEALRKFHRYYGDDFLVEFPTGSGTMKGLHQVADELSKRLISTFLRDPATGMRPVFGPNATFQTDADWTNLIPFYEYFNGDTGQGLGASHQTGWTALVASLFEDLAGR